MQKFTTMVASIFLFGSQAIVASASPIFENTGGALGTATLYFGQSFTTPSSGSFAGIMFNFYSDIPAITPTAGGTAFLLTEMYLGSPGDLSPSTPGFLAQSIGVVNDRYIFDNALTLQPNTKYYLYTNVEITTSGGNVISGGEGYLAVDIGSDFFTAPIDGGFQSANFLVSGTAVPESPTFALVALALVVLGLRRLRGRTVLPV